MKQNTIRLVDRWAGTFLCALFTAHRRTVSALVSKRGSNARAPRRILFIKMIEQGATVLAYSAIRRAIEMVGRENVLFLVFAENRFILDAMGVIPSENVLVIRRNRFLLFAWDTLRAILRIRELRIDTTIDMEFFTRAPALIAYLSGARVRVGLHRFGAELPYRGDLMTHRIQYNPYLHTAVFYRLLVEAIERPPEEVPLVKLTTGHWPSEVPSFLPAPGERSKLLSLLEVLSPRGAQPPIVLLNPNASDLMPLRRWPRDNFIALGRALLERRPDLTVVVTGAPCEAEEAERIARTLGSPRAFSVAGKTSLRDLIVLYTISDVLVTNDSGPAHFASMTDIHSVVLFGPETPALFGALSTHSVMLSAGLACSPCVNVFNHRSSPCRDNRCMREISVSRVLAEVERALDRRSRTVADVPPPERKSSTIVGESVSPV